jgi:hypothetical protein
MTTRLLSISFVVGINLFGCTIQARTPRVQATVKKMIAGRSLPPSKKLLAARYDVGQGHASAKCAGCAGRRPREASMGAT